MNRWFRFTPNALIPTFLAVTLGVTACCTVPEKGRAGGETVGQTNAPAGAGPSRAEGAAAISRLAGTAWQLVGFTSTDDATGTVQPADPSVFTMELKSDGTVAMRLDCNRAAGSWNAEPAGDGTSGSFRFGPLAATRALCPPPNLDEQITRQAEYIRGYLLREGRLYLSLFADGGVYEWEPVEAPVPSLE